LRQHFAETTVLAAAGGLAGLGLAWLLTRLAARHLLQGSLLVRQFWIDVRLDARSLAFCGSALVIALLLGGLLPAWSTSRTTTPVSASRTTARGFALLTQRAVVALELGLSFALLVGTALLLQGALWMLTPRLGFDPTGLSRTLVVTYQAQLGDGAEAYWERALGALRARPEVDGAVLVSGPPWAAFGAKARVRAAGAVDLETAELPLVALDRVAPGTFELLRLPLRRGRTFDTRDAKLAPPEAALESSAAREQPIVVSESLARRHLLGTGLDQRLDVWPQGRDAPMRARVVGVVADLGLDRSGSSSDQERLYLPLSAAADCCFLLVRARGASTEVGRAIEEEVTRPNPLVATLDHRTFAQERAEETWAERRLTQLFLLFGGTAALLGAAGLHGVLTLVMRQRERELGIRAAIGAAPRDLIGLVVREGSRMMALGIVLGSALAVPVVQQLGELLRGGDLHLATAVAMATAVSLVASTLAALRPARRAAGADPVELLHRD
jgi:ABC-type lipoprotein release transport system permease subunit